VEKPDLELKERMRVDFGCQEVELHEEPECQRVFSTFVKFLYTCHVPLTPETALPMLVLADKYNVVDLREVCIRYARAHVIPKLQLKDVFHVWFQYATRYDGRPRCQLYSEPLCVPMCTRNSESQRANFEYVDMAFN